MQKAKSKLATTEPFLWRWSRNSEGKHPVKMRVTFNRERRYYTIDLKGEKIFLSAAEWEEIQNRKTSVRTKKKAIRKRLDQVATQANSAVENATRNNRPFTWEKFESEFMSNESGKGLLKLFEDHLETLRNETPPRIGTRRSYNNSFQAFKDFRNNKEISPFDLTPSVLKEFEAFLLKRGCGKTTCGIYTRALKVIFNIAADKNPALLESYPFARKQTDRNRYKIRTGSGHKGEALSVEQLQTFLAIETDPAHNEHEAKKIFLFSLYAQGMNLRDIFQLKYKDIQHDTIRYVRQKTKETETTESIMEIPVGDSIRQIIQDIGNPDKRADSYIFMAVPNGLASGIKRRTSKQKTIDERIYEIITQKIKMVNLNLKSLCKNSKAACLQGLNLTSYWSRHSFASLLKESGESIELIREMLGHSDVRTTENYLKRFDNSKKRQANEKLESLLNQPNVAAAKTKRQRPKQIS